MPTTARLVSPYAIKVIELALRMAGQTRAVITSTLRTPEAQAAIIYRNASTNLAKQFELYGSTGDEVLRVFRDNRSKDKATVIALMVAKIEELALKGRNVSLHVTTTALYKARNIIDIGVNSTRAVAGSSLDVPKLTAAFAQLETDGYIARFIDETAKSNSCWHLEIKPNVKPLPTP